MKWFSAGVVRADGQKQKNKISQGLRGAQIDLEMEGWARGSWDSMKC